MSRVRINRKVVKLKEERKHYLSGNTLYAEGRTQGKVEAKRDFGENIYEQNQFDSHLELTIPLPTELIKLGDDVDYDSIAKDLVKSLKLEGKYGVDNVAYYVHHRDETSGRTNNDNLHVHVCYVDRVIEKNNEFKLYQSNKRPHGINLISGKNIRDRDFNDNSIHHFKVESDTAKLDFSLVEEDTLEKFKVATSNGRKKKFSGEELNVVNELKKQIISQAQTKSVGAMVYSNRLESADTDKTKLRSNTKEQRVAVAKVLNEIIDVYELTDTKEKYGYFNANTKKQELEASEEEINIIAANLKAIEVHKESELRQIKEERELLTAKRATLDVENAEVLKKLKEDHEEEFDQIVNKRAETIVNDYVKVLKIAETEVTSKDRKVVAMSKEFANIPVIKRREGLTGKSIPTYAVKDIAPVFSSMIDYFNEVHKRNVLVTPIVEENKTLKEQNQKNKDYDPLKKEYDNLKFAVEKMYETQVEEVYNGYQRKHYSENETKTKVNKVKEAFKEVLKPVIINYWEDKVLTKLGLAELFKKKKADVEENEPNVYVRPTYEPTPIYNTRADDEVEWKYDSDLYEEIGREKEAELDDEPTR